MTKPKKTEICPACGSKILADHGSVAMGEDGLPIALSLTEGLGLPIVDASSCSGLQIFLNGAPQKSVVAFDRSNNFIWRHQKDAAGNYMVRDGRVLLEKVEGLVVVTVGQ